MSAGKVCLQDKASGLLLRSSARGKFAIHLQQKKQRRYCTAVVFTKPDTGA
jgi:hypothetical protein